MKRTGTALPAATEKRICTIYRRGRPPYYIAKRLGVSVPDVLRVIEGRGIRRKKGRPNMPSHKVDAVLAGFRRYRTLTAAAKRGRVSVTTARRVLVRAGLYDPDNSTAQAFPPGSKELLSLGELYKRGITTGRLAKRFKVSTSTVTMALHKLSLRRDDGGEAVKTRAKASRLKRRFSRRVSRGVSLWRLSEESGESYYILRKVFKK